MPRLTSLKNKGLPSSKDTQFNLDEDISHNQSVFQLNKDFKDKLKGLFGNSDEPSIDKQPTSKTLPTAADPKNKSNLESIQQPSTDILSISKLNSADSNNPTNKIIEKQNPYSDLNLTPINKSADNSEDVTEDKSKDILHPQNDPILYSKPLKYLPISTDKSEDITKDKSEDELDLPSYSHEKVGTLSIKSRDIVGTQVRTEVRTKLRTKVGTVLAPEKSFSEVSPLSQKILKALFTSCLENMGNTTGRLSIHYISNATLSTEDSVKRTIRRLISDGILEKIEYKDGRGGWTKYQLHKETYSQIMLSQSEDKSTDRSKDNSEDKVRTQVGTQPSNSNNSIKNTTTNQEDGVQKNPPPLPHDWQEIDITPLKEVNFTNTHLAQIYRSGKVSADMVQESINAYAFDLFTNKKQMPNPINFFMGILVKNGMPYSPPDNYISPRDAAIQAYLLKKRQKEKEREALESEAFEYEFRDWRDSLGEEQALSMVPNMIRSKKESMSLLDWENILVPILKEQFSKTAWPEKKLTIFGKL